MSQKISIFWFRRDLRLFDNRGLFQALSAGLPVLPIFIFDRAILDELDDRSDRRVEFIHARLLQVKRKLEAAGGSMLVKYDHPEAAWEEILSEYQVAKVFTNHDYEPYALERDSRVGEMLAEKGIEFHTFKDQVIFEKDEILSGSGTPYTVFTPFSKKWKATLTQEAVASLPSEKNLDQLLPTDPLPFPTLEDMNFQPVGEAFPSEVPDEDLIKVYDEQRNFPAIRGTSRLSVHLRFGTVSVRQLVRKAIKLNEVWLNELIWREFYMYILWHFPHVATQPFRAKYNAVPWRNNEEEFKAWCEGRTGYPIVDAGMRELNATGFMHNRVRMITASFLTKHLLIDWRWGEAYFAQKLLDFELASNNGGWQWASGTGTDAAPYFRIFNPTSQTKKFDPKGAYIQKWVPEFGTPAYPKPIVEHKFARERCLEAYKSINQSVPHTS